MQSHPIAKIIVAVIALFIVGGGYAIWQKHHIVPNQPDQPVACTLDAKICPDGSAVGRQGPNCEFAACPNENQDTDIWDTATSTDQHVTFQYPHNISTQFVRATDWPPQIQVVNQGFSCTEAGLETGRAGITEKQTINNHNYCVTRESEGAAGSTYTQYAYALPFGSNTTAIFTFTVQFPQCLNYDEPNRSACQLEQNDFKPLNFVDRMAQTLHSTLH